jgi:hypothetical protein
VPARAGAHSPHPGGMYPIRPHVPCERENGELPAACYRRPRRQRGSGRPPGQPGTRRAPPTRP